MPTDLELILNDKIKFLMFHGEAGQDFLLKNIYQYSNLYKENTNKPTFIDNPINSTIMLPGVFSYLQRVIIDPKDNLTSIETLLENFIQQDESSYMLSMMYAQEPQLIPVNEMKRLFFKNKTYFLLIDDERWMNYVNLLTCFKSDLNIGSPGYLSIIEKLQLNKSNKLLIDRLNTKINELVSNGTTTINKLYLYSAVEPRLLSKSIDEIFNMPLKDLYALFPAMYGTYMHHINIFKAYAEENYTVVKYSEFFNRGYLENIFEIDDSTFHDRLLQWHADNLTLLSSHGVDVAPFAL